MHKLLEKYAYFLLFCEQVDWSSKEFLLLCCEIYMVKQFVPIPINQNFKKTRVHTISLFF